MKYNFEWDPNKAKMNIRRHGISFEQVAEIFTDHFTISVFDEGHSQEEERWITIGKNKNEKILVVIHTFDQQNGNQCNIRIISARKATKKETKQYEER